uniref:Uncharacterized protein n=1 Tax=Antithamnion hubbsii TaxID=1005974 RepID=A0A4D6WKR4_9FLOR|nr:hypothetical protein [Antithamnion hubbsii]
MILFNKILIQRVFDSYLIHNSSSLNNHKSDNYYIKLVDPHNFLYVEKKPALYVSKLYSRQDLLANSILGKSKKYNYQLISRNFFIKFVNQFWQETIFLSISNPLSELYIDKLKVHGLSINSQEYKNFLAEFSKGLISGRIKIAFNTLDAQSSKTNNITSLKYIWKKGLNLSWPNKGSYLASLFTNSRFPNKVQQSILRNLSKNQLPLFSVINNFNQIILSESSDEILIKKNILDHFYQWYSKYFLHTNVNKVNYQGLFFVSSQDAEEYKEHMQHKYANSSESKNLKVFATKLQLYYKLVRSKFNYIEFRLIPDLVELGQLVSKYQYYNHIKIHSNQYCTKNAFQGQPVYFIEPVLAVNNKSKKIELIKYIYPYNKRNQQLDYKAVFMNYKTAMIAWQKFRQQMLLYDLPVKPKLTIYNLESFIKQCESNPRIDTETILFVPSVESYLYVKNKMKLNIKINWIQRFMNNYSSLKVMSQRMVWSLTSRQPTNF